MANWSLGDDQCFLLSGSTHFCLWGGQEHKVEQFPDRHLSMTWDLITDIHTSY